MNGGAGDELVDEAASMSTSEPQDSAVRAMDLHRIQKADPKERDTHKTFLAISRVVASPHEATTLGIILGISRHDVTYYVTNYDIRDVAFRFLCWAEDNCGPVEKWENIIEALTQLEKNNTILELGLQDRLVGAKGEIQKVPLVKSSATST